MKGGQLAAPDTLQNGDIFHRSYDSGIMGSAKGTSFWRHLCLELRPGLTLPLDRFSGGTSYDPLIELTTNAYCDTIYLNISTDYTEK